MGHETMPGSEEEQERCCPGCGLPEEDWPLFDEVGRSGFIATSGEEYCCEICARGGSCGCAKPLERAAI